jgi:hypothetical protein
MPGVRRARLQLDRTAFEITLPSNKVRSLNLAAFKGESKSLEDYEFIRGIEGIG